MQKIRKGDEVIVIAGRSKGQRGNVLKRLDDGRLLVENVNMVKKHVKGNPRSGEPAASWTRKRRSRLPTSCCSTRTRKRATGSASGRWKTIARYGIFKSNGEVVDI